MRALPHVFIVSFHVTTNICQFISNNKNSTSTEQTPSNLNSTDSSEELLFTVKGVALVSGSTLGIVLFIVLLILIIKKLTKAKKVESSPEIKKIEINSTPHIKNMKSIILPNKPITKPLRKSDVSAKKSELRKFETNDVMINSDRSGSTTSRINQVMENKLKKFAAIDITKEEYIQEFNY